MLFGHRGCSTLAPENTLSSFTKAKELEIPGVELDVQSCRSGELIVFHDFNLKRITGLDKDVGDTDFKEIRDLDAGSWFDKSFSREKIPTMDEVFDCLGESVYYDIEIKNRGRNNFSLERSLLNLIRKRNLADRIIVSSFNPHSLRAVKKLDPEIRTALIYSRDPQLPLWLRRGAGRIICQPQLLKPDKQQVTPFMILWKKKILGYPLIAWTEDNESTALHLLKMGVDGIISNQPEKMLSLLQDYQSNYSYPGKIR